MASAKRQPQQKRAKMPNTKAFTFFQPLHLQPKFIRHRWYRWLLGLILVPTMTLAIFFLLATITGKPLGLIYGLELVLFVCFVPAFFITYKLLSSSCGRTFQRFITIPKERTFATAQLAIWKRPIPFFHWRLFNPEEVINLQLVKTDESQELYLNISQGRSLEIESDRKDELANELATVLEKEIVTTEKSNRGNSILWTESKLTALVPLLLIVATAFQFIAMFTTPTRAKRSNHAYDCYYLYAGDKRLNNATLYDRKGVPTEITEGLYWSRQQHHRGKELTFAHRGHRYTFTTPIATDTALYYRPPHGAPNRNSIGKRRYFKVDIKARTITPWVLEDKKLAKLIHLLAATLLLTIFVVVFGFRATAAGNETPPNQLAE